MAEAKKTTSTAAKTATEKKETPTQAQQTQTAPQTPNFSWEQVQALVARSVAQAVAAAMASATPKPSEDVTLLFIGAVAAETTVQFGNLGRFTRGGTTIQVPKKDFLQNIGEPVIDYLLMHRLVVVVDGLTDDERERYGLKYAEGELMSETFYCKLLDYSKAETVRIYEALCPDHKRTVAKIYLTAYFENHDNRVNGETVKALNKLSKTVEPKGLFTPILEDMGDKFANED